jgi:hypothetical protein
VFPPGSRPPTLEADRFEEVEMRGAMLVLKAPLAVAGGRDLVDGFLEGANVHDQGQLVDAAALRFQGSIRPMPATAG